MFRDDAVALAEQNQHLRRDNERLAAENAAMRAAIKHHRIHLGDAYTLGPIYERSVFTLSDGERVAFGQHSLTKFPVWAALLLHVLTFGVSSIFLFARAQGRLPRLRDDDPTAARAAAFFFIPYANFWWMFFAPLRLNERLNFQYQLRNLDAPLGKAPVILGAVSMFFMYFLPILWLPAVWKTQKAINDLVDLGAVVPNTQAATTGVRVDEGAVGWTQPEHAEVIPEAREGAATR
jgi:hypothetical protein